MQKVKLKSDILVYSNCHYNLTQLGVLQMKQLIRNGMSDDDKGNHEKLTEYESNFPFLSGDTVCKYPMLCIRWSGHDPAVTEGSESLFMLASHHYFTARSMLL